MEIKNVTVRTETRYSKAYDGDNLYFVVLELPVPGGKIVYELKVSKEVKENIETASQLCK